MQSFLTSPAINVNDQVARGGGRGGGWRLLEGGYT